MSAKLIKSNRTVADCKKLIAESALPYQIIRINGVYRLVTLEKKIKPNERKQSEAAMAPIITNFDELYAKFTAEAEEFAKAIEAEQENLVGLSDEDLAKHMTVK